MYTTRPYDRHDKHSISIMTPSNRRSSPLLTTPLFILFSLCAYHGEVGATPLGRVEVLERRDDQQDSSISPKVWIPVAVAIVLLSIAAVMSWKRKTPLFNFSGASAASPLGGGAGGRTRELTAEQLAGTINNGGRREVTATELAGGDAGAPRPARRTRRPRRTPSQMSVTSLPVYNKEPGEEEVVIFRGRDMEDITMPAAVVRNSNDDDDDDDSMDQSREHSSASRYSEMPTSPHDMPLLYNDDDTVDGDLSMQNLQTPAPEEPMRRSLDTGTPETGSLMRSNTRNSTRSNSQPDPRGEAPPYFEVVDDSTVNLNDDGQANGTTSPSTSPEPINTTRRSGLRGLLNRMSIGGNNTNGHSRNQSSMSALSSNMSLGHRLEPTTSRISHRTTPSGGSGFMFRTISRQRSINTLNNSTNQLNSPSMISLNSISAPLTHTATRTEFTYPKTGPTAEQLKVISSRETFTRFGVPYGADAIAFASSSRLDLSLPPPDFETVANERAASPGPSRLRSVSNVALTAAPPRQSTHSHSSSTGDASVLSNSVPSTPAITASSTSESQTASEAVATSTPQATDSSISQAQNPNPAPGRSDTQNNRQSGISRNTTSPSSAVHEFGTLAVPAASPHNDASVRSHATFATAVESLTPSTRTNARTMHDGEFFDAESDLDDAPSTSRIGGQHALEATDTTITQSALGPTQTVQA
ncbi:hypothetical protein D9619_009606 [Psilocybe cf. subviscida]|uniref:Uncharacterized protein n=1 Tax=Psilocybe cf. subviscida TaxID=2480587 RepID=A0A8H5F5Z4_9AGAR|nr:hypothetical protein D9619_009606 [Psilocybe cf. subviscida]